MLSKFNGLLPPVYPSGLDNSACEDNITEKVLIEIWAESKSYQLSNLVPRVLSYLPPRLIRPPCNLSFFLHHASTECNAEIGKELSLDRLIILNTYCSSFTTILKIGFHTAKIKIQTVKRCIVEKHHCKTEQLTPPFQLCHTWIIGRSWNFTLSVVLRPMAFHYGYFSLISRCIISFHFRVTI